MRSPAISIAAVLVKGRVLETILNTEQGVASCGSGSQPLPREVRDPRPLGTTTRTRGARCDRSGSNSGEGSAGPEPKIATVERREASVPRYGTQGASLGAWPAALRAGPTGASQAPDDSRRSATPSIGVSEAKNKTRARKTRRGNEEVLLGADAFTSSF